MNVVTYQNTKPKSLRNGEQHLQFQTYFGEAAAFCDGPQVFMVEYYEPESTIEPHFHDVDQFQIVLRGAGRFGHEFAEPLSFHYADAYTPYGPIVSTEHGISFLTIRAAAAGAFFPMPASRHLLPCPPGRNMTGKFVIDHPLPGPGKFARQELLGTDDGARVVGVSLAANASFNSDPADAGGQYYVVCKGTLLHEGAELPELTVIQVEAGEAPPRLTAGSGGAQVLLAQLPRASSRLGSDVRELAKRKINYSLPKGSSYD